MQDFTIDIIEKKNSASTPLYIRMTTFTDNQSNPFGSFDEKLTLKENSAINFSFSMYKYVNEQLNPYISFLVNDRLLQLKRGKETLHFVITNVTPTISNQNVKYSYTCQDEFSYNLSRRNVGMKFTTDDSEEYENMDYQGIWDSVNNCGPKTIVELVNKLFEICSINDWILDRSLNSLIHSFPDSLYTKNGDMRVTLNLSNTNPFNALIEIAKLFNAIISIDYTKMPHVITFLNKDLIQYNGFDLRPISNMQNFTYSERGDNLYNIMHVTGGEDADGNYISMMPTMPDDLRVWIIDNFDSTYETKTNEELLKIILQDPNITNKEGVQQYFQVLKAIPQASSFLYDFSYWKDNYLISEQEYNAILHEINIDLRNINLKINAYTPVYYKEKSDFEKLVAKEEELITLIAAEDESMATTTKKNADTVISFYNTIDEVKVDNEIKKVIKLGIMKPESNISSISFQYGYYLTMSFSQFLPEWKDFIEKFDELNFYIQYWNGTDYFVEKLNKINIKELNLNSTMININTTEKPALYNITLYCDAIDSLVKITVQDLSIDTISQNAQSNYVTQLINSIWTDDYIYLYRDLYGKKYVANKIQNIQNKILEKQELKQKYIKNALDAVSKMDDVTIDYGDAVSNEEKWYVLRNQYGSNISATNNYPLYTEYAYNKSLIADIETYIGGPGTRIQVPADSSNKAIYYNFKGYYNHYLEQLQKLQERDNDSNYDLDGDIYNTLYGVNGLTQQQNNWWSNFYINHNSCIRETTYTDSNQLTNEGLYGAAIKQFDSYKLPNQTFNVSYINSDLLLNYTNEAKIGDVIKIYQPELFNNQGTIYIAQILNNTNDIIKQNNILNVGLAKPSGVVGQYTTYSITVLKTIEDGIYNLIYFSISNTTPYDYKYMLINNKMYQLLSIMSYNIEEPVQLQITGITKDLRSTTEQLVVTKYNTINSIVDKILYSINN